jgi:hypothetical protein
VERQAPLAANNPKELAIMEQKYLLIKPEHHKLLAKIMDHHNKWMIDLFSPKGLSILFSNQKVDG